MVYEQAAQITKQLSESEKQIDELYGFSVKGVGLGQLEGAIKKDASIIASIKMYAEGLPKEQRDAFYKEANKYLVPKAVAVLRYLVGQKKVAEKSGVMGLYESQVKNAEKEGNALVNAVLRTYA